MVRSSRSIQPVMRTRRRGRDVAVAQVVLDGGRVARLRVAVATAAGIDHAQPRAGRDGGAGFRVWTRAVGELDDGGRAVAAAEQSERRMIAAIGQEREPQRSGCANLDLRLLPEAAAKTARATRIRAQL